MVQRPVRTIGCSVCAILLACTVGNASDVHRVVTGLGVDDKSTTLLDGRITLEVNRVGIAGAVLWTTDSYPLGFSQQDTAQRSVGIPPLANGTTLRVIEFPPMSDDKLAKMDPQSLMKIVGANAPKRGIPVSNPMMHRTRTVDYAIVMSGEIDMMLDDKTVHLKAGDVVVQQATNHAFINHSTEPCRVIFVLMDSKEP